MKCIFDEDYFADTAFTVSFPEGFTVHVCDTLGDIVTPMEYDLLLRKYAHSVSKGLLTHLIHANESLPPNVSPDELRPVFISCKILRPRRLIDLLSFDYIERRDSRYRELAKFKDFDGFKMFCEALMEEIDFWYERTS